MKNKKFNLFLVGVLSLTFISCTADLPKDHLLVPPKFDEVPTKSEVEGVKKKIKKDYSENNADIQELKDLLLD